MANAASHSRRSRSSRLTLAALLLGATAIAACGGLADGSQRLNHYAAINITARGQAPTRATANATVVFFDAFTVNVPSSALQRTDQCTFSNVDTSTTVTKGAIKVGSAVALAVGGTTLSLPYDSTLLRYANPTTLPFSYANGDVAQVTLPGAAGLFPAATISVPLAEPVLPGNVPVPDVGFPMSVVWTASSDSTAAILLTLKYANPVTSAYANEAIFCTLKDDGRFDIPAAALNFFLAAPNASRSLQLTRWRTRETLIDANTLMHIASSVDTIIRFQ